MPNLKKEFLNPKDLKTLFFNPLLKKETPPITASIDKLLINSLEIIEITLLLLK